MSCTPEEKAADKVALQAALDASKKKEADAQKAIKSQKVMLEKFADAKKKRCKGGIRGHEGSN